MRTISFAKSADQKLGVRIDGQLVMRVVVDLAQVKAAKSARMWTPKMQDDYLKQVGRRLADEGVREDETKAILAHFKAEVEQA